MAHLSCVGETTAGPGRDPRPARGRRDRQRPRPARRPAPRRGRVQAPGGRPGLAPPSWPASSRERYRFAIGGACFPEVHPEAPSLEADLAYLKTKVDVGRQLPDHPALLRQPRLLRLRRRRARDRDRGADHPRRDPDRQLRPDRPLLRALRRLDPGARSARRWTLWGATRTPRPSSAWPTRRASARSCWRGGAPGIHFYTLNRAPATRAVLGALRVGAAVGAGRLNASPAP